MTALPNPECPHHSRNGHSRPGAEASSSLLRAGDRRTHKWSSGPWVHPVGPSTYEPDFKRNKLILALVGACFFGAIVAVHTLWTHILGMPSPL